MPSETANIFNAFLGHPLTALETASLLLLAASVLWGLVRGLSKELFGLTSWVGAALITCREYDIFVPWLNNYVKAGFLTGWISGAAVFLLSLFVFNLIGRWLTPMVRMFLSAPVDALLGALFGGIRGWMILTVLYFIAIRTVPVLAHEYFPPAGLLEAGLNESVKILNKWNPEFEKIQKQAGLAQELWEVNQGAKTLLPQGVPAPEAQNDPPFPPEEEPFEDAEKDWE